MSLHTITASSSSLCHCFNYKLMVARISQFLAFMSLFVFLTIAGTLTHELGHYTVARMLGYQARLHYGSVTWDNKERIVKLNAYRQCCSQEIKASAQSKIKREYNQLFKKIKQDIFLVTLGGPLQTIMTGTIGFLFLVRRRSHISNNNINKVDWLLVFLSLFWLREIMIVIISVVNGVLQFKLTYFGGDESSLSKILLLPEMVVPIVFGLIGSVIVFFVIFKIIPAYYRSTFILGGLVGGTTGYLLWYKMLGPIIFL